MISANPSLLYSFNVHSHQDSYRWTDQRKVIMKFQVMRKWNRSIDSLERKTSLSQISTTSASAISTLLGSFVVLWLEMSVRGLRLGRRHFSSSSFSWLLLLKIPYWLGRTCSGSSLARLNASHKCALADYFLPKRQSLLARDSSERGYTTASYSSDHWGWAAERGRCGCGRLWNRLDLMGWRLSGERTLLALSFRRWGIKFHSRGDRRLLCLVGLQGFKEHLQGLVGFEVESRKRVNCLVQFVILQINQHACNFRRMNISDNLLNVLVDEIADEVSSFLSRSKFEALIHKESLNGSVIVLNLLNREWREALNLSRCIWSTGLAHLARSEWGLHLLLLL